MSSASLKRRQIPEVDLIWEKSLHPPRHKSRIVDEQSQVKGNDVQWIFPMTYLWSAYALQLHSIDVTPRSFEESEMTKQLSGLPFTILLVLQDPCCKVFFLSLLAVHSPDPTFCSFSLLKHCKLKERESETMQSFLGWQNWGMSSSSPRGPAKVPPVVLGDINWRFQGCSGEGWGFVTANPKGNQNTNLGIFVSKICAFFTIPWFSEGETLIIKSTKGLAWG